MSSSIKQRKGGRKRKGNNFDDSNNSVSASASIIGSNTDILILILIRIPSKSLLVFKSVSKQWLSIITDPKFVHKHLLQNPKFSTRGLFWGDDFHARRKPTYGYISLDGNTNNYVPFETVTFREKKIGTKIVQSCNGLLLCKSCSLDNCDFTYYIYNPFTKKYKTLLQFQPSSLCPSVDQSFSLAFDPFKSPYYKVIAFWKILDGNFGYKYRTEIYDSETSSWRLSGFHTHDSIPWSSGIFWNGSLYWCHGDGSLVYFDINQGLIRNLRNPAQEYNSKKTFYIAVYGGHFYLCERDRRFGGRFRIFEMDAANSNWNVKGQVIVSSNPYMLPFLDKILFITTERGEEKELTKVVLLTTESTVVSYDLKDLSFEKLFDLSTCSNFRRGVKFHQYIESLACV